MTGKGPTRFTAFRDGFLLIAGTAGIGFQQVTGETDLLLLGIYMTMLGIPGFSSGLWLLRQIGEPPSSAPPSRPSAGEPPAESDR